MEVSYIKKNETEDITYNKLVQEYSSIFPQRSDQHFTLLTNLLHSYLLNQDDKTLSLIKTLLKRILDKKEDELLYKDYKPLNTSLDGDKTINEGLNRLMPTFIKMRQISYQSALKLSSYVIEGKIPDYELHEDFHLLSRIISDFTFENFYADIAIYNNKETIKRFNNELELLDTTMSILRKESIDENRFNELENFFGKERENIFRYLKTRFLTRKKKGRIRNE